MAYLILDTNIFYDLANGSVAISDFAASADKLFYSPLSVLEIAGKWSTEQFGIRKGAARAILDCGASELTDQDSFLAQSIFSYPLKRPIARLHDAFVAMAKSRSVSSLESGVADYQGHKVRRVDTRLVQRWRGFVEGAWVKDMELLQEREIPGFSAWERRSGEVPEPSRPEA